MVLVVAGPKQFEPCFLCALRASVVDNLSRFLADLQSVYSTSWILRFARAAMNLSVGTQRS